MPPVAGMIRGVRATGPCSARVSVAEKGDRGRRAVPAEEARHDQTLAGASSPTSAVLRLLLPRPPAVVGGQIQLTGSGGLQLTRLVITGGNRRSERGKGLAQFVAGEG